MDDKTNQLKPAFDQAIPRRASRLGTPGLSGPTRADAKSASAVPKSLARARGTQRRQGTKGASRAQRLLSVPLKYLSATIAILLATFLAVGSAVFDARATATVVVVAAILIFANGFSDLVQAPQKYTSAFTIVIVGAITVIAIRLSDDFAWAAMGLALAVLVAAVMEMTRPLPRPVLLQSLSASVFAGFVVVIGSAWVILARTEIWATIMVSAAIVLVVTMVGNQLGASAGANALWALVLGPISGVAVVAGSLAWGRSSNLLALAFPSVSNGAPDTASILIMSGLIGLGIGVVIVIVDMLFGEHNRRISEAGAFSRGAMKFMLAVMPIYVMVRIGAII